MFKIPKLSAEEKVDMARGKEEREEREEREEERKRKERAKLSQRAGLNYGLTNPAMQKAGLMPLNKKKMERANRAGFEASQAARAEQQRREEGRREAEVEAEQYFQQYLATVRAGGDYHNMTEDEREQNIGLRNRENLPARAQLLEKSLAKDSQALYAAHLAKTLVMMGQFDRARVGNISKYF